MSSYRLVEYGITGGRVTFAGVYHDVNDACTVAERIFDKLEDRPHRRPHTIDVVDVWTGETITRLHPNVERDPGVCPACHAPSDPFAAVLPAARPLAASGPIGDTVGPEGGKPGTEAEATRCPSQSATPRSLPGDPG